ncbi:hypothetical protein [Motilibacter rhizosphaerae]|uniref:hypothetical protein n=1 Tax=Motilibacter rhizosphaerae TaxID=598652 RepID=UPI00102C455A|nr:hypothetical protein [Motilibacter rhizosphaerae]
MPSPATDAETFAARLVPVLQAGDLAAARQLLDGLEGDELRAAKEWFAGSKRWVSSLSEHLHPPSADVGGGTRVRWRAAWTVGMCAVRLCGPVTAAARVPWADYWDWVPDAAGEAALVQLLREQDREWAASFVEAASGVSLGGRVPRSGRTLSRVLRAVAVHHDLPCPSGATFLATWWAGAGPYATLADLLVGDPLMPDVLLRYLGSGHAGGLEGLPAAVAEVCGRGQLDRGSVLEQVLESLTAGQRPKAQRELLAVATALELRADEVPGGLTYLLGLLATVDRQLVPALLDMALDLVRDGAALEELAVTVAARPEQGARDTLLKALGQQDLQRAAGTPAVLASLDVLGATDDAAFGRRVVALRTTLGGAVGGDEERPVAVGLWTLAPAPGDGPPVPRHLAERPDEALARLWRSWEHALSGPAEYRRFWRPLLVHQGLVSFAAGGDGNGLRATAVALVEQGECSLPALAGVLEDVFLGGALRQLWPVALELADLACATSKRPAGLEVLLRMLATYAVEVPEPRPAPPHVAALAARRGQTKAQSEARVLLERLAPPALQEERA